MGRGATSQLEPGKWEGQLIDDRYRVLELIGKGGMGAVYRVRHERLGKFAAMKVLRQDLASNPVVVKRFRQEAAAISTMTHPNIVQVFDFGITDGNLFLIMELIQGSDLEIRCDNEPINVSDFRSIIRQTCLALSEAHNQGIVHRDIKPENILVTSNSRGGHFVKVVDFGLAKLQQKSSAESSATESGLIVGTPYFMAPEQIKGERITPQTDVYSLGATMYRVLSGTYPFNANSPVGILTKHLSDGVPPLTIQKHLDANLIQLEPVLTRAMAKNPSERYSSADALSEAVEHALATTGRKPTSESYDAAPTINDKQLKRSDLEDFERKLKRRQWYVAGFVSLLLASVAGFGYYFLKPPKAEGPRTVEHEPNNSGSSATVVTPEVPIEAYFGSKISDNRPDTDYYLLRRILPQAKVTVSGIPNIRLHLTVVDHDEKKLADKIGESGEDVTARWSTKGVVYIVVSQQVPADGRITENIPEPYQLLVTPEQETLLQTQ